MDLRDLTASVLTAAGIILVSVGVGVLAGLGAALVAGGAQLVALGVLIGWRTSTPARRAPSKFERPIPFPVGREKAS